MSRLRMLEATLFVDEDSVCVIGPTGRLSVREHQQLDRLAEELQAHGVAVQITTAVPRESAGILLVYGEWSLEKLRTDSPELAPPTVLLSAALTWHMDHEAVGVQAYVDMDSQFVWKTRQPHQVGVWIRDHLARQIPTLPGEARRSPMDGFTLIQGNDSALVPAGIAAVVRALHVPAP